MQVSNVTLFMYSPYKKLLFTPVASTITTIHGDHLVLASNAQWPEIQPLVS